MASFQFYGYEARAAHLNDLPLAIAWTKSGDPQFWLRHEPGIESFVVLKSRNPVAFFQIEHTGQCRKCNHQLKDNDAHFGISHYPFSKAHTFEPLQARIHFQAATNNRKSILRGITMLVPLIEKALALRGVKALFFTSHSQAMAVFMQKRLGYQYAGDGRTDGMIMAKGI